MDRQTAKQADRQINGQTDRWMDRQTDGWSDRRMDRQTARRTNGQTGRHAKMHYLFLYFVFYHIQCLLADLLISDFDINLSCRPSGLMYQNTGPC